MSKFGFEIHGSCFFKQDGVCKKANTRKVLANYTRDGRTLPLFAVEDNIEVAQDDQYSEAIHIGKPVYLCE